MDQSVSEEIVIVEPTKVVDSKEDDAKLVVYKNTIASKSMDGVGLEHVYTSEPRLGHLKVFRGLAFAHIAKERRYKLDLKAIHCIIIGYNDASKTSCVHNPQI